MQRRIGFVLCIFSMLTAFESVYAGNVKILPTRVMLHSFQTDQRADVLKIMNEGTETIHLRLKLFAWEQSPSGEDVLTPTTDVHFPKMLSIAPADESNPNNAAEKKNTSNAAAVKEALVKLTCRIPAPKNEKAYRLLIEEVPVRKLGMSSGTLMTIRLSLPLFLRPAEPSPAMEIEDVKRLSDSTLSVTIRNPGNSYIKVGNIVVSGYDDAMSKLFSAEGSGWYVLAGMIKTFEVSIPSEKFAGVHTLNVLAQTDATTATSLSAERTLMIQENNEMMLK